MRRGAAGTAVGLALAAAALAGCTQDSSPAAQTREVLGSWTPPEDAPAFCSALADGAEYLDGIPGAIGRLVADPADTQQARQLSRSAEDLRQVRDAVREDGGHEELVRLLDDLVDALALAASGPVDACSTERIGAGLLGVGGYVQPLCGFPT